MNYQVLARKWRPDSFEALVGQSHVVRALTNALTQQRLHHAYLFTGTRGVGKTTLGRLLAKCLNCATGITAKPCNSCQNCQEIASGRFIDLIEVDAASRTKVEDTRELLENVPYSPTSGRFKVYLIDEVHMLSTHSFNALLKTLEEPPSHVKFFLATTDPQKLPITVLSRCLQFHLKCLPPELIAERLAFILEQEGLAFEQEALTRLAYAAEGSMRDALSLLDQAIAFSNGDVATEAVKTMLSSIEATHLYDILTALHEKNAGKLINITQQLVEQSLDCANALEELLSLLHQIAIAQFIEAADTGSWDNDKIRHFAKQFSPQDIQLFYQIGLIGRKDLPLAPTPRIGLEMVLLRMLAFQPGTHDGGKQTAQLPAAKTPSSPQPAKVQPVKPATNSNPQASKWEDIVAQLKLTGLTGVIANNCILESLTEEEIILAIDPQQALLLNKKQEERLTTALQEFFHRRLHLTIRVGEQQMNTPAIQEQNQRAERKSEAQVALSEDTQLQKMIQTFNATLIPDSIELNES